MSQIPTQNIFDRNFKPEIPASDAMIKFGIEMLSNSSIGIELITFMREKNIEVRITRGPEETSYVAGPSEAVIVLKSADPAHPSRFVLLLAGVLRQIMQEYENMQQPHFSKDMEYILEKMRQKQGDRIGYMCAVAYEINQIESFSEYHLLDELKNMGYAQDVETFLQNI